MCPFPAQGHINPILCLAKELNSSYGFLVTFINTDFAHNIILNQGQLVDFPNINYVRVQDGISPNNGEGEQAHLAFLNAMDNMQSQMEKVIGDLIANSTCSPLSCIISDAFFSWMQDVADKFNLPRASLWTTPTHANIVYLSQSLLISKDIIPFKDENSASKVVDCILGVSPMPASNLLVFFHAPSFYFDWFLHQPMKRANEALWKLGNNVYDLERTSLDEMKAQVSSYIPIGPLLPSSFLLDDDETDKKELLEKNFELNMWKEEIECLQWLDTKQSYSVIYISFGTHSGVPQKQLEEITIGLEASEQPFLWPLLLEPSLEIFDWAIERSKEKGLGFLVKWAPQLQILSHVAIGGFVSHCGWNSLLESLSAGVPLLTIPRGFAEQKMNSKYITEEWGLGMEMEMIKPLGQDDKMMMARRDEVERVVRAILGDSQEAHSIKAKVLKVREMMRKATREGGNSHSNLDIFVEDIKRRAGLV